MELTDVILGFLDWRPLTGYELKSYFSKLDFLPWSGNNNQIYTALVELEKKGQVTKEVILQENLPAQKRYSVTEAGHESLRKAVLREAATPDIRNNFLLHLSWAHCLTSAELTAFIGAYERRLQDELLMSEENMRRKPVRVERSEREAYVWEMIAQNRIDMLRCELNWLAKLKNGLAKKGDMDDEREHL